ncbi:MAG: hypothetical protein H7138_23150 [Myxococcales bacterium]|nr:hypothetical protein [Myxococcales bacterium]
MHPEAPRTRRRATSLLLGAIGAVGLSAVFSALVACSSYDPSLPDEPFLCGEDEPRCPDGYACVARGSAAPVCRKDGTAPDAGVDAAPAVTAPIPSARPISRDRESGLRDVRETRTARHSRTPDRRASVELRQ